MSPSDADRWVALELNFRAEGEDPDIVCQSIQNALKGAEVFIPAVVTQVGDARVVHYLVDGYAFLRRAEHAISAIMRLENSRYVNAILTEATSGPGRRRLSTVTASEIDRMRSQIALEVDQGICIGDKVSITSGHYRNIEATVVEEIPELEQVQVYVRLRSKQSIVTLPRSFLRVTERSPLSPVLSRLTALGSWTRAAQPVFQWSPDSSWAAVETAWAEVRRIFEWQARGMGLFANVSFLHGGLDLQVADFRARLDQARRLDAWAKRLRPLAALVDGAKSQTKLEAIRCKYRELQWLDGIFDRVKRMQREFADLAHHSARRSRDGGQMQTQNVLVDGHNLAFRCLYAPGMSDLKDSQGRPTGMILGFLTSLGSLKKRFPDARLYVAWDGSSRRRKQIFGDYKANRPSRETSSEGGAVWDPLQFLRTLLPTLGVRQVFNPEEEADDVIATLVRGALSDQNNLIFTSDRDLLQLVSATTRMLAPSAGSRKEAIFDVASVDQGFGVRPEMMSQLRAFYGDASDNIPGVPRVPKKVLRSLVQAHGSVEGVFRSGLTGLTKGQYERLRSAEPQIKLNLTLMTLIDVPVTSVDIDPDPDAVADQLRKLAIHPDPIIGALFGKESTAV